MPETLSLVSRIINPSKLDKLRQVVDEEIAHRRLDEQASQRLAYEKLIENLGFYANWFRDSSSSYWVGFIVPSRELPAAPLASRFEGLFSITNAPLDPAKQVDTFTARIEAIHEAIESNSATLVVASAQETDCLTSLACLSLDASCEIFFELEELARTIPRETKDSLNQVALNQIGNQMLYHTTTAVLNQYKTFTQVIATLSAILQEAKLPQAKTLLVGHVRCGQEQLKKLSEFVLDQDLSVFSDGERIENEIRANVKAFDKWSNDILQKHSLTL